ncbi:hypothetical protein CONPUDRAFT_150946 [Coniophora puteana RWD-64-598 SS2]|uniref:Uncharacterized protein n=1 Tax=Coniophora puteana (strain RWD-64-598) TaxID=741705 RepID=A0A5M3MXQ5_CONPW|nr:uncharacterized protein CONPUDRAFT_150946 [Coniophora puteana RWD-64-598 SS2]EIW83898.1 hypothetical protein CONPUDRAFT_150946 [Coniophora puteana RWD-64-598 SS2]
MPAPHCYVLGGSGSIQGYQTNARGPFIAASKTSPPFPIAVFYHDATLTELLDVVQEAVTSLANPRANAATAVALLRALGRRADRLNMTRLYTWDRFYPIVYGKHVGVYFRWEDAEIEVTGLFHRRFQRVRSFSDALVFMITKARVTSGDGLLTPPAIPSPLAFTAGQRSTTSSPQVGVNLAIPPSGSSRSRSNASRSTTGSSSQTPSAAPPPNSVRSSKRSTNTSRAPSSSLAASSLVSSPLTTQHSEALPPDDVDETASSIESIQSWVEAVSLIPPAPLQPTNAANREPRTSDIIYCHSRSLSGIQDTYYEGDELPHHPDPPPMELLGPAASHYFSTHGFLPQSIWTIYYAFKEACDAAEFVGIVARRGTAQLEAGYIFDLISGRWREADPVDEDIVVSDS